MLKENRLEKLISPVKWSAWLYVSYLENFARWHFFDVRGVFVKKLCKRDDETAENMGVAGKIFRSTEIKSEVTESKLSLLLKHDIMHVEIVMNSYCVLIIIR